MRGNTVREKRREEAILRAEERAKHSHKQQLELLDQRFGEKLGATKERARLKLLIEKDNEPKDKRKKKTKRKPQKS